MELGELPEGWAAVTLEAVADVHDNLREPVNSTERKKRVGPFPYYGATGQVGWIDDFRQDGEYILLGEDGAPFFDFTKDKAYLVSGKCWVNNHAHVLKGREGVCLNRYLLYALNQVNYRGYANGTTRLKLTQAAMRQLPINLAPLAEQHRIVAKIEELFSELDQGVASLKTAREQLKVYRQSLLKNAFEGKLTAAWRAAHRDQLETATALQQRIARERQARYQQQLADWQTTGQAGPKPKQPKHLPPLTPEELAELPELPAGWGWVRPEEIASQERYSIGIGPFGSCLKVSDYRESGVPLIFVKNITRFNFSTDLKYIAQEKFEELSAHSVQALDLLITKMGDPPGDCEIYPEGSPTAVLTADCLKFRLWDKFANRLLYKYCINSNFVKRQLGLITRGVAQKKISVERFKTIALPLMSVEEQKVLVEELESKLSEADQLDQTLATALQQADALRQSILKKAFHGQLVKQAKNEEPATVLLERIRAARLSAPGKKKTISTAGATR